MPVLCAGAGNYGGSVLQDQAPVVCFDARGRWMNIIGRLIIKVSPSPPHFRVYKYYHLAESS